VILLDGSKLGTEENVGAIDGWMDPEGIVVGSNDGIIVGSNDGCNVIEGPLLACRDGLFEG